MQKKKILYIFTSCRKCGPIQIMLYLMKNLDRELYEPILITVYPETEDSRLNDFISLNVQHYFIKLSKLDLLIGNLSQLKNRIDLIKPDVIHSMGVFVEFAVSRLRVKNNFITLHNFMYEDYPLKFGKLKGKILIYLQSNAIKKAAKVITCSSSLSEMYKKKGIDLDFIRNGVDTTLFYPLSGEKNILRRKLHLPIDKTIFVYAAQMIERKNHSFLLKAFKDIGNNNSVLLLLGDGPKMNELKELSNSSENIIFQGNVNNVIDYLQCCDCYISSSTSEGLPTGVIEAMACSLPVILSKIMQHEELFSVDQNIGFLFLLDDADDCKKAIRKFESTDTKLMKFSSLNAVHAVFDAKIMTKNYEKYYEEIISSNSVLL